MQKIDYIQDRLYANQTPFSNLHQESNYEDSILFSLPKNVPEPFEDDYQNIIERSLIELASIVEGRIFVQFSGTYQLKETAGNITPRLTLGNYAVFDEFSGTSREVIIEQFLSHKKSLLFGKRGLWQNAILPTESIDAFVLMRLPFISPIETVNNIRSKSYENAFLQYVLPETVLRFRQIVEKFLRVHTNKSVFMVLDSRVVRKRYGSHFMETLPTATIQRKSVAALPYILRDWVNGEKVEE
jgi:DNA polymerase-3 subunit epsilon/ATP-dependent DNA helicase DinG